MPHHYIVHAHCKDYNKEFHLLLPLPFLTSEIVDGMLPNVPAEQQPKAVCLEWIVPERESAREGTLKISGAVIPHPLDFIVKHPFHS